MNATNPEHRKCADIQFRVSEGYLVAELKADKLNEPLTKSQLIERLNHAGFENHELNDELITKVINSSTRNQTDILTLAEHQDASFDVVLEDDQVKAYVAYKPAIYGKTINKQSILDELQKLGVKQDLIKLSSIEKLLSNNEPTKALVAEGVAPISGEDAYFEVLFVTDSEQKLKQDVTGSVDHYETHQYITVTDGKPVMQKFPATAGKPGRTVMGESLTPDRGKDCKFTLNKSVKIDPENKNILLAATTGHPVCNDNVVQIDETLNLQDASLETGNIHYDGSVKISGDVKPNVVVEASGDIFVEGLVENATLIAGNTVTIQSGVISSRLHEDQEDQYSDPDNYHPGCRLVATKDIYIKYCNSVHASAGGSIFIENYSLHSILEAKESIIAGINNGQGILLGGKNQAEEYIEANIVGSDAYVPTRLICAQDNVLMRAVKRKTRRISRMKEELDMLNNVLNGIKQSGSPDTVSKMKLKKAKKVFREIQENKQELLNQRRDIHSIKQQLQSHHPNRIKINKTCFPNVSIRINDIETKNQRTRQACAVDLQDTELVFT